MAGWTSDDSNLKTTCPFCDHPFVPFLSIEITDYQANASGSEAGSAAEENSTAPVSGDQGPVLSDRYQCLALDNEESDTSLTVCNGCTDTLGSTSQNSNAELITVPYLCPLVLRKELESLLENEGGDFLSQPELVNSHPIIYWNLVWFFQRLSLPSNLLQLVMSSKHVRHSPQSEPFWLGSESPQVAVHLMWDVLTPDSEGWPPLFALWRLHGNIPARASCWRRHNHPFTLAFLEEVLRHVGLNEVHKAISLFMDTMANQLSPPRVQSESDTKLPKLQECSRWRSHPMTGSVEKLVDFPLRVYVPYSTVSHGTSPAVLKTIFSSMFGTVLSLRQKEKAREEPFPDSFGDTLEKELTSWCGDIGVLFCYGSIYREILFLTLAALGKEHTDIAAFDKKYKAAYNKLASSLGKEELKRNKAQLPNAKAVDCRKSFGPTLEC